LALPKIYFVFFILIYLFFWIMSSLFTNIYKFKDIKSYVQEISQLFVNHLLAILALSAASFFYKPFYDLSRLFILYYLVIGFIFLALGRMIIHLLVRIIRSKGYITKRVIFVGISHPSKVLIKKLLSKPHLGYKILGYVDDKKNKKLFGIPCLGKIKSLPKVIDKYRVQQVYLNLALSAYEKEQKTLFEAMDSSAFFYFVPDSTVFSYISKSQVHELNGIPIFSLNESALKGWNLLLKDLFDKLGSIIFLILFSPLLILIALLVKLSSRGPVFYSQTRSSINGKPFKILKFRTMPVDAEKEGAQWSKNAEKRATKIGKFLRATSLDELPQLINVFFGQLSLVGPRPERPVFIQKFRKKIPNYMQRHRVRCGMTGWAQVNGFRGDTSLIKRIEYDQYYINNWSFMFDLKILWLTLLKMVKH